MTRGLPKEEIEMILVKTGFYEKSGNMENGLKLNKLELLDNLLIKNSKFSKFSKKKSEIENFQNKKFINIRWIKNIDDTLSHLKNLRGINEISKGGPKDFSKGVPKEFSENPKKVINEISKGGPKDFSEGGLKEFSENPKKVKFLIMEYNLEKLQNYRKTNSLKNLEIEKIMKKQNDLISLVNNLFLKFHKYHIVIKIIKKDNKNFALISFSKNLLLKIKIFLIFDKKVIKRILSIFLLKWIFPEIFCFIKKKLLKFFINFEILQNLVFCDFSDFNFFLSKIENEENLIFRKIEENEDFVEKKKIEEIEENIFEDFSSVFGESRNIENLINLKICYKKKKILYEKKNLENQKNQFFFRLKFSKKKKIGKIKKIEFLKKNEKIKKIEKIEKIEKNEEFDLLTKFEDFKFVKKYLKLKNFQKNIFSLKKIENLKKECQKNFFYEKKFFENFENEKLKNFKFSINEILLSNINENNIFEKIFLEFKNFFFEIFEKKKNFILKLKIKKIQKNKKKIF